jgi:LmbE family N-acetylglucosaminyl deacetylase
VNPEITDTDRPVAPGQGNGYTEQVEPFAEVVRGAASLLVIAPHPDDDVLGCGALIAWASTAMPVRIVYVTDGAASHVGSSTHPPERLRTVRETEAMRAAAALGVTTPPIFVRIADGHVPPADSAAGRAVIVTLRDLIPAADRVAVALPWRRDPHADHRAVSQLVRVALTERPLAQPLEYAVWLGLIGEPDADEPLPTEGKSIRCDARPWLERKRAAINEHHSQLGRVIHDATDAFVLPAALLERALGPQERFVLPWRQG